LRPLPSIATANARPTPKSAAHLVPAGAAPLDYRKSQTLAPPTSSLKKTLPPTTSLHRRRSPLHQALTCAHELELRTAPGRQPRNHHLSLFHTFHSLFILYYYEASQHASLPESGPGCCRPIRCKHLRAGLGWTESAVLLQPEYRIRLQPWYVPRTAFASQDIWTAKLTTYSKRHLQLISGLLGSLWERLCFRSSAVPGLLVLRLHPRRPRIHR
jgi:hypothetical protein